MPSKTEKISIAVDLSGIQESLLSIANAHTGLANLVQQCYESEKKKIMQDQLEEAAIGGETVGRLLMDKLQSMFQLPRDLARAAVFDLHVGALKQKYGSVYATGTIAPASAVFSRESESGVSQRLVVGLETIKALGRTVKSLSDKELAKIPIAAGTIVAKPKPVNVGIGATVNIKKLTIYTKPQEPEMVVVRERKIILPDE